MEFDLLKNGCRLISAPYTTLSEAYILVTAKRRSPIRQKGKGSLLTLVRIKFWKGERVISMRATLGLAIPGVWCCCCRASTSFRGCDSSVCFRWCCCCLSLGRGCEGTAEVSDRMGLARVSLDRGFVSTDGVSESLGVGASESRSDMNE